MENEYIFRPKQINYLKFDTNPENDSQKRIINLVSAATATGNSIIDNGIITKIVVRPVIDDKYGLFIFIRKRTRKLKLFCNQEFEKLEMNFSIADSEHSASEVCPPIVKINLKQDRIHILDPGKNHKRPTILYRYV